MASIFKEIERNYEKLRDRNERHRQERLREVYSKLPEIKEIDFNIRSLGFEAAKSGLLSGDEKASEVAKNELEALKAMKESILLSNGYNRDFLEERYHCKYCKDQGTLDNGDRCSCYNRQLTRYLYRMSNVERMIEKQNFATFDLNVFSPLPFEDEEMSPRENMKLVLEMVNRFIETFEEYNDMNLLFYGSTGQGKTFLCNSISGELLERNYSVIYQTAFTLVDILEQRKFRNDGSKELELQYNMLMESDLLVIDDLGTEMANNFTNSQIFNIVNTRMIAGKKTLISSNLTPTEISQTYTDRVFSRVFDKFIPMRFYGPDLRWE